MGITTYAPSLYAMQTDTGLHGFRRLVIDYITAPISGNISEWHSQANGYATVRVSMPPRPLPGHYMIFVTIIWAPHLDMQKGAVRRIHPTLIFEFSIQRKVESHAETMGQYHGDRKDPCW
jgi:hypothetical protein